jgi:S1-C subfamily serine protease
VLLALIVIGGSLLVVGGVIVAIVLFVHEVQREFVGSRQAPAIGERGPEAFEEFSLYDVPLWEWDMGDFADLEIPDARGPAKPEQLTFEAKDLDRREPGPQTLPLENPVPVLTAAELQAAALTADGSLSRDVLQRVEDASVRLRVTHPDRGEGPNGEGSGFFALEPGLIITNAHVVGMKQPGSQKPTLIEVFIHSGEPNEKKLTAQVLAVDGNIDLAILKVREKEQKLPEPLQVVSATKLNRTQQLVAFGFPYGERLNKRLSTSKVSVASPVYEGSEFHRVQMNGQLNPGNSGGPVVDSQGRVVGVAVAIYVSYMLNTGISYAVPGDQVLHLYQGRLGELTLGQPVRSEQEGIAVPVTVQLKDPLDRIRRVGIDWWLGDLGDSGDKRGPAFARPPVAPGDTEHQTINLVLDKGRAKGELKLAPLPEGKVYWVQPFWVGKKDANPRWTNAVVFEPPPAIERRVAARPGAEVIRQPSNLRFSSRSRLLQKGMPAGNASPLVIQYEGRVTVDGEPIYPREYSAFDMGVRIGERTLPRHLLRGLLEHQNHDALRRASRPAFVNAGAFREELAALSEPVYRQWSAFDLKLPSGQLQPGQTWNESQQFVVDVISGARMPAMDVTYTCLGTRTQGQREEVVVSLEGDLASTETQKSNGRLRGIAWIDAATNQLALLRATLDGTVEIPRPSGGSAMLGSDLEMRLEREK